MGMLLARHRENEYKDIEILESIVVNPEPKTVIEEVVPEPAPVELQTEDVLVDQETKRNPGRPPKQK